MSTTLSIQPVAAEEASETPPPTSPGVEVSVLVAARNRNGSLSALHREYAAALRGRGFTFEFLFLMDRSSPDVVTSLLRSAGQNQPVRVLYAENTVSDTVLIRSAVDHARGEVILLLPPVPRVIAAGVPLLLDAISNGADIAVACREPRRFTWIGRIHNRLFHHMLHALTGAHLRDVTCGLRAIRRSLFSDVATYGDMSPYLPLLAAREGFIVEEVCLPQHPSDRGTGFHGPNTYLRKLMDLLNLFFLLRFAERPLRFFGVSGGTAAITGLVLLAVLFVQRLGGHPLANRPILVLAVLLVIVGLQAVALGLIGEVIVHLHAAGRRPYRLAHAAPTEHRAH